MGKSNQCKKKFKFYYTILRLKIDLVLNTEKYFDGHESSHHVHFIGKNYFIYILPSFAAPLENGTRIREFWLTTILLLLEACLFLPLAYKVETLENKYIVIFQSVLFNCNVTHFIFLNKDKLEWNKYLGFSKVSRSDQSPPPHFVFYSHKYSKLKI
jgi:hypothetical protein